jgi:hypothetical protein
LTATIVPFNAVHEVTGASGSGHFILSSATGFRALARPRAYVKIVSDSLTCQIIGPASADKAVSAFVAILCRRSCSSD